MILPRLFRKSRIAHAFKTMKIVSRRPRTGLSTGLHKGLREHDQQRRTSWRTERLGEHQTGQERLGEMHHAQGTAGRYGESPIAIAVLRMRRRSGDEPFLTSSGRNTSQLQPRSWASMATSCTTSDWLQVAFYPHSDTTINRGCLVQECALWTKGSSPG